MSAPREGLDEVYPGLWECPHCQAITDETHFYEDRASGVMQHQSNAAQRATARERCGWRYDYDGYDGGPKRCALKHGHGGLHDPQIHGYGKFTEHAAFKPAVRRDGGDTP